MYKDLHQLDAEELDMLTSLIESDMPKACVWLFADNRHGKETIVKEIGQWAVNRKVVLDNQIKNNPHVALVFEKVCYRIWQKLPGCIKSLKIDAGTLTDIAMTLAAPEYQSQEWKTQTSR